MVHHMKTTMVLPHATEDVRGKFWGPQHPRTGYDNDMQQPQFLPFYQTEVIILPTQTMHYITIYAPL